MIQAAIFVVVPLCLAFAAFSDLFTMTIPNRDLGDPSRHLRGGGAASGMDLSTIGLICGCASSLPSVSCCFRSTPGGGDAKLLTAWRSGSALDASLLDYLLLVSVCGGLLAVVILVLRGQNALLQPMGSASRHLQAKNNP